MRDWLAAGLTASQFRTLVKRGDLVRLRRGVYATASFAGQGDESEALSHFVQVTAAIHAQYKSGSAAASHQSAAILHGIGLLGRPQDAGTVWLTRPPGKYRGDLLRGVRLHSAELPEEHVTAVLGTPVTGPARTVLDLARSLPYAEGVIAADSALQERIITKDQLQAILPFFAGWPGTGKARRVVEFSDPLARSPLESAARVVFAEHGLPAPELQASIPGAGGPAAGRADFYWPGYQTIAEAGAGDHEHDSRLRDLGYRVVRFTWADLFGEPDRVITRVRTAFGAPTPY